MRLRAGLNCRAAGVARLAAPRTIRPLTKATSLRFATGWRPASTIRATPTTGQSRQALSLVVALALGALGATACEDADDELAVDAVRGFVGALERGDGRAACERLSEAGVSELLLTALRAGTRADGLDPPSADRCAVIASRLGDGAEGLAELRRSPVSAVRVEGDRATVETRAGAYEAQERDGRWLVGALEPVARATTGSQAPGEPVHLSVVRPKLTEPALGPAVAGRTDDDVVELSGTLDPADATLTVRPSGGTRVTRVEARDGRFGVALELTRGRNEIVLAAAASGRERTERAIRLTLG